MKKNKEITILKKNIENIVLKCFNNVDLRLQDVEDDIDFSGFKEIKHINHKLTKNIRSHDDVMMVVCGKKFYRFLKVFTALDMLEAIEKR